MRGNQRGVLVVDVPRRGHGTVDVTPVWQLRRGREHLHIDAGAIHQPQPRVKLVPAARADPALRFGVCSAQFNEHVEVGIGPVVRVNVDPHVCQQYALNGAPRAV
jgi:hypothetical protein